MKEKSIQLLIQLEKDNEWFKSNYKEIEAKYEKEFIAIKDKEIVAHAKSIDELIRNLKSKKIDPATTLVKFIYEKGTTVIF
jgi:hypothetical protein